MRNVKTRATLILGAVLLATVPSAWAGEWVSVAKTDRVEVFVKVGSVNRTGNYVAARTKENFATPQPSAKQGKTYLSARNDYRIDCAGRKVAYSVLRAYAGPDLTGAVVQKATSKDSNLKWMDAPAGTVFGELLDYACKSGAPTATGKTQ